MIRKPPPDDLRRLPPAEVERQITEMRWRLGVAEGQLRKDTRRRLRQLEAVRREWPFGARAPGSPLAPCWS